MSMYGSKNRSSFAKVMPYAEFTGLPRDIAQRVVERALAEGMTVHETDGTLVVDVNDWPRLREMVLSTSAQSNKRRFDN